MRLGLIADVHADPRALEDALRGLDSHGVDLILCAGDLVGYGGEPDAAVDLLRDRAIPCVWGNHDRWAPERCQVLGRQGWKPAVLRDDTWEFLTALPASDRGVWAGWVRPSITARPPATPSTSRLSGCFRLPSTASGRPAMPGC